MRVNGEKKTKSSIHSIKRRENEIYRGISVLSAIEKMVLKVSDKKFR